VIAEPASALFRHGVEGTLRARYRVTRMFFWEWSGGGAWFPQRISYDVGPTSEALVMPWRWVVTSHVGLGLAWPD
jgi:hypothetical protein